MTLNPFLPNIPFFCIHLKHAVEREAFMTHFQNGLGRTLQEWPATEGSTLVGWPRGHPHERETSLGALGCLDSHIRLLQMMIERNYEVIGIFEDDAEFVGTLESLHELTELASNGLPPWDLLILGANEWVDSRKIQGQGQGQGQGKALVQVTRYWGTHAFLITRKGAHAVLEVFEDLQKKGFSYPADWLYSYAISKKSLVAYGPEVSRSIIRQKPGLISAINGKVRC